MYPVTQLHTAVPDDPEGALAPLPRHGPAPVTSCGSTHPGMGRRERADPAGFASTKGRYPRALLHRGVRVGPPSRARARHARFTAAGLRAHQLAQDAVR